jgi:hypothetical protein
MDLAVVVGDEYADATDAAAGQGVYRLGGPGFTPVAGAKLSQFDGVGTNAVASVDDDGNRVTDTWEAAIPWAALNAPSGILSVTSLRVAGVLVGGTDEGTRGFIHGSYLGRSAEGATGADGNFGFNEVVLRGAAVGLPDRDGDQLTDGWESRYGLDPDDDGSADPANGAEGDPDGDGATNAEEQAAGTHPRDPGSVFALVEVSAGATGTTVTTLTQPGQRYRIEYLDGGLAGPVSWKPFADQSPGVGTWVENASAATNFTFVDDFTSATTGSAPTGLPSRIYRVHTERP